MDLWVLIAGLVMLVRRAPGGRSTGVVPVPAHHQRPAGTGPGGERHQAARRGDQDPGRRGLRAAQAAQVVGAGRRALLRLLGVPHPRLGLPRGVRDPLLPQPRVGDPDRRALGPARLRAGLHRGDGAASASHLRRHPAPEQPGQARPQVPVQRLPPRRRLGDPRDDLQRHLDDVPVPWRRGRRRATCRTATAPSPRTAIGKLLDGISARAASRRSRASGCCSTSA